MKDEEIVDNEYEINPDNIYDGEYEKEKEREKVSNNINDNDTENIKSENDVSEKKEVIDTEKIENKKQKDNKLKIRNKNQNKKNILTDLIISFNVAIGIFLILAVLILILTGNGKVISNLLKLNNDNDKNYTYTKFIQELNNDKISKIDIRQGTKVASIVLKTEEEMKQEAEIISKFKDDRKKQIEEITNLKKAQKEEFEKNKKENPQKYLSQKEELEKRTKKVNVPTLDSFTEIIQSKITEGKNVEFNVKDADTFAKMLDRFFAILPTILIIIFLVLLFKMQMGGKTGKVIEPDEGKMTKIKFKDVAGLNEEKEQLLEIVDFLKNPEKYEKMGAKIPAGILLYGQPGTGKTLIAKAIAGEAGVPFISVSGSEFVEMFVGLGAQRVRKLFEKARQLSPSIIFIDEIDAVGTRRSGNANESENNQTLNQLLVEMDGFNTNHKVIVLAATNRPETLDKALLRPGRFDRQIIIPAPDVKGRKEILKLHAESKKISEDVNFDDIAQNTAGYTGAELSNILNEAAIIATKNRTETITKEDIEEALKKVMIGLEKQNKVISEHEKKITAYHESGHAIVSYLLPTQEDVKEVTIIPRGMAGGYTMYKTTEDKSYISKRQLEEDMIGLMGGRAAEDIIIKDITTGASNDISRATKIARNMIIYYGMSEKIGPISLEVEDPYELNFYGQDLTKEIGVEVKEKVEKAFITAKKLLLENIDTLHLLAQTLLEKETIKEEEFKEIMEKTIGERTKI